MGGHEVGGKGCIHTENSQMTFIGATITSTYHIKQLNPWPNSLANRVVNYSRVSACTRLGWYWKRYTAIVTTESLKLLPQHCIGIFYYKNWARHHYTFVPLETTIASLSIGMNLWVSIVVIGTNLISTLYRNIVMCTTWQYSVIYLQVLFYWNVKVFAILILQALILQGDNNIEILPNPSLYRGDGAI